MNLLLLAAIVTLVAADKQPCETISVRGKVHKKDVLTSGYDRPYHLSIYRHEHKIFFSYNDATDEKDTFKIGYLEKGKKNATSVEEVVNGFATAVDQENHHVYLGGSKGIYRYHMKETNDTLKIIDGHNIWYMFYHKHLYFIDFPSQKLYLYKDKKSGPVHQKHIKSKIYQYVIDKDGDQFFTNDSGLYRIKDGSVNRYSDIHPFRGATLDNKGNAYFCASHSIYATNKTSHSLEEIANVRNVFGITFDKEDNIIYSDPNKIVKLLPGDCK